MIRMYLFIACVLFAHPVWADIFSLDPLLNKVLLQLHTEQWVTTKTALVNVGVNASVSDQGIVNVQNDVIQKLNQLSNKGEWHIVTFDRQLDKSGLESIQITAQARLPPSELGSLRDKAKAISKPGETFTIDNVQFIPSEDELRQANVTLRNNIYAQAKDEINALNKVYPEQKYYLHSIDFMETPPPPASPMPMQRSNMMMAKGASFSGPLSVGNKVELQASIVIASLSDQVLQKLTHP